MGNGGIGKQAFNIRLCNGNQIADDHRQRGQHCNDRRQVGSQGGKGQCKDTQQGREAGDLGAGGHESSH